MDGLPFPRSSAQRDFTRVTRGWRLLRAPAKARLYRCKSLFAGIYVRAKQVPGSEAPQYDNAITPPPSPADSPLLAASPTFFQFSIFSLRNPFSLFTEDFAIVPVPIVTLPSR